MVKVRKGSRRGLTKVTKGAKRQAKRKAQKLSGRIPKSQVRAPGVVRENWSESMSRIQNMQALGLVADVNKTRVCAGAETAVVAALRRDAERGEKPVAPRAAPGEVAFVRRAVAKHGYDYTAIARDIGVNYFQWTPTQIRKKVATVAAVGMVDPPPSDGSADDE